MNDDLLIPKTHLLDGFVNQGMSWPAICGEMIDNAFGAAAGDAQNAWIKLNDKRAVFTDDGNGVFDLNELFTFGGHHHDINKTQFDIGRYGLGSKYAALALGWKVRVQTVREGTYHKYDVDWRHVRDQGPKAWPRKYASAGEPAARAPKAIRNGGTIITVTDIHKGRRLPTVDALRVSLARIFKPALRDGREVHIQVNDRKHTIDSPDTVRIDDRVEARGGVSGMGFSILAGALLEHTPSMNHVFYGFGHRIISQESKLCGHAIPPLFYCEVLLDAEWKEHLQTTKLGITKYRDELEAAVADLAKEVLEMTKTYSDEARLDWINAQLARHTAKVLVFKRKGDTHDPSDEQPLTGEGRGGDGPSPNPGPEMKQTARPGSTGGAGSKTNRPTGIRYRMIDMDPNYAVSVVSDDKGVEVRLNQKIDAIRYGYDAPFKIHAVWPVIAQGFASYLVEHPAELEALIPDYDTLFGVTVEEAFELHARLFAYLMQHQPADKDNAAVEPKPGDIA